MSFIGIFAKWNRDSLNSANSGKLINHWSMNWAQFKDPVSHMCLAGTVVASWSFTQSWLGGRFELFNCNDKYFCHWIQWILWKHLGKTQLWGLVNYKLNLFTLQRHNDVVRPIEVLSLPRCSICVTKWIHFKDYASLILHTTEWFTVRIWTYSIMCMRFLNTNHI